MGEHHCQARSHRDCVDRITCGIDCVRGNLHSDALARRRASIDFFLKTEIDEKAIDLYDKFRTHAPSMSSIPPVGQRDEYKDIRSWLNICELIAVGVRKRAFSKSVSHDYWGDVIPRNYRTAERLINEIRNNPEEGSAVTYIELEKLAKKWAAKAGMISANQSSWSDLPLNFHPAAIRASAVDTPIGAV